MEWGNMKRAVEEEMLGKERRLPLVLTVGHSTHTIEEFIRMLLSHGVTSVVDVRTIPRSRHNAQFNKDSLPLTLKKAGIGR
jgi:uncharacterized protein (DUF488 family)